MLAVKLTIKFIDLQPHFIILSFVAHPIVATPEPVGLLVYGAPRLHGGLKKSRAKTMDKYPHCIKGESNPRRVDGNDLGYHYPINAYIVTGLHQCEGSTTTDLVKLSTSTVVPQYSRMLLYLVKSKSYGNLCCGIARESTEPCSRLISSSSLSSMNDSRWCPQAPYVAMDQYSIVRWYSALRKYCVCSTVMDGGADGVAGAVGPQAAAVSSPARGSLEIVLSALMSATGIGSPMCCSI